MSVVQVAVKYGARGWPVVLIHGIVGGKCTCGKRHECSASGSSSAGKHPVFSDWAAVATVNEEDIVELYEPRPHHNVGIVLGERSGIIDVEFDSADGEQWANEHLGEIYTPSFRSHKSLHRLFLWEPWMPARAKVEPIPGLEFRIGGGGLASQSVFPPSQHLSGATYRWLDWLSPDDVDVQPLPLAARQLIEFPQTPRPAAARIDAGEDILEGERDDHLFRLACSVASEMSRDEILDMLAYVNEWQCKPPLPKGDIERIAKQAARYGYRDRARAVGRQEAGNQEAETAEPEGGGSKTPPQTPPDAACGDRRDTATILMHRQMEAMRRELEQLKRERKPSTPSHDAASIYEQWGLQRVQDDDGRTLGWLPGAWQMAVLDQEPPMYRLYVPAWREHIRHPSGGIHLRGEDLARADTVADAILAQTRRVDVRVQGQLWATAWAGRQGKAGGFRGLRSRLLESAIDEPGDPSLDVYVILADYLLDQLSQATPAPQPLGTGYPTLLDDGRYAIEWRRLWQFGINEKLFTRSEVAKFGQQIGVTNEDRWQRQTEDGKRRCITHLSDEHVQRAQGILDSAYHREDQ
jgi:hypothetical protein